jgi:hypothetical protein
MEYFKSITQSGLSELIISTKKSIYLSLPSIHYEIAGAICYLDYMSDREGREVEIHILVDFDSNTFRQGYGNFDTVNNLIKGEFDVRCLTDNRISFIISDNIGYYLFIESRSLIPADKETINAIKIDPVSIVRLKHYFFPEVNGSAIQDELANAIIEESILLKEPIIEGASAVINEIDESLLNSVKADLEKNPPLNPDFKRTVELYSNKFQYAELHYKGQNIEHFTIEIPSKLLPYKNIELRKKFITRLKLFENINKSEDFVKFKTVEECKNQISEKYLTPIKCRKGRSVLKKEFKVEFENEIAALRLKLNELKNSIYSAMSDEIETAKTNLCETMRLFLLENPTEDMITMGKNNHERMAKNISKGLTNSIRVDPAKLITKFKIDRHYADITFEDLSDSELLEEFKEKELIDEADETRLADFSKGIKVTSVV